MASPDGDKKMKDITDEVMNRTRTEVCARCGTPSSEGLCNNCEKAATYKVTINLGKPCTEETNTLESVEKILRDTYLNHIYGKDDNPHCDVIVEAPNGDDITETQAIQEMFANIIEQHGENLCAVDGNCRGIHPGECHDCEEPGLSGQ
jgi:hypothetical protein